MEERVCPKCGKTLPAENGAAFCQYCGASLHMESGRTENKAVQTLIKKAETEAEPKKKYAILSKAMEEYPDSLAVAEELLLLGRLYERNPRMLDFSVIKSNILNAYLEPESFTDEQSEAMRQEIFSHPDLERCLALTEEPNVFLHRYLTRLSVQYIELFLRGSSRYMRRYFGIGLDSRAPKYLAYPAAKILNAMRGDPLLTGEQRAILMRSFYGAFSTQMSGDTKWLDQTLEQIGLTMD